MSAIVWKPNGEECPDSNLKDVNGFLVWCNDDETERLSLSHGQKGEGRTILMSWFVFVNFGFETCV
jgi:hypothetical protein